MAASPQLTSDYPALHRAVITAADLLVEAALHLVDVSHALKTGETSDLAYLIRVGHILRGQVEIMDDLLRPRSPCERP